jgi:hypothetical protein
MTSYLIKGQTTGRRYEEGGTVLVVRIQHVYLGAREIQGASFEVTVYQRGGHGALVLNETPSVGEEGLWLVRVDEKEKKVEADVVAMQKGCDVVSLPVFATDSLRYRSVEMWAEDVHKVAAVPRDDQIGYVRQLCLATDNYATRAWCVSFIGEHGAEDDLTYLRGLVSQGQVPVRAQLAIDEVLCLRKGKVWYGNKERSVLLERWVSVPLDKQVSADYADGRRLF